MSEMDRSIPNLYVVSKCYFLRLLWWSRRQSFPHDWKSKSIRNALQMFLHRRCETEWANIRHTSKSVGEAVAHWTLLKYPIITDVQGNRNHFAKCTHSMTSDKQTARIQNILAHMRRENTRFQCGRVFYFYFFQIILNFQRKFSSFHCSIDRLTGVCFTYFSFSH